jgi:hypothetical protein
MILRLVTLHEGARSALECGSGARGAAALNPKEGGSLRYRTPRRFAHLHRGEGSLQLFSFSELRGCFAQFTLSELQRFFASLRMTAYAMGC